MTWAGESGPGGSGLMTYTSDGSPGKIVGSGVQLVGWVNGKPEYKQPDLNDLLNVNAGSPLVGEFLEWNGSAWAPGVASGTGGANCFATGLLDSITTTSLTFVAMPGMLLTPPPGNYHCLFSSTGSHNKNGAFVQAAIFANGTQLNESTRDLGGQANNRGNFNCQAVVATTGEALEVRWRQTSAGGGGPLGAVFERLFIITECEIQT